VPLFPVPVPATFHAPARDADAGFAPAAALALARQRRGPAVALVSAADVRDLGPLTEAALPVVVLAFEGEAAVFSLRGADVRSVRADDQPGLGLAIAEALASAAPTVIGVGIPFA
jgi:hypothetical protein